MKKLLALVLAICAGAALFESNMILAHGSATYSKGKNGLNDREIRAPFGCHVLAFDVIPKFPDNPTHPFTTGGIGMVKIGIFGGAESSSNRYPSSGNIDRIEMEKITMVSGNVNEVAMMVIPADKGVLKHCGHYVLLTRDPGKLDTLKSIVEQWGPNGSQ